MLSLPVRECGLKFSDFKEYYVSEMSLPVRECGLKFAQTEKSVNINLSLPVRECGLKFAQTEKSVNINLVTPCAGVWIEIELGIVDVTERMGHSLCGSVD